MNVPYMAFRFHSDPLGDDRSVLETSLDHRFLEFHRDNPGVYEELAKLARQAKSRGRTKLGIKMLFEVVRWQRFLETNDPDFKLNNSYTSRYARSLMDNEPDLQGIFETRELRS